jgi:hypothetical protein
MVVFTKAVLMVIIASEIYSFRISLRSSLKVYFTIILLFTTRFCSWLTHYVTSRMVAGSIPDDIIGFINYPNPTSLTIALASTQPLTEMSTRNLPGG